MPRPSFPEFGQRLRALFGQRGLKNQSEFAGKHGWSAQKFGRWLRGSVPESRKDQEDLARAFGVSWNYLMTGVHDDAAARPEQDAELRTVLDEIGREVSLALAARPSQRRKILAHLSGQVELIRILAEPEDLSAPAQSPAATAATGSLRRPKTIAAVEARRHK